MVKNNELLEFAQVFAQYGTLETSENRVLRKGRTV